MGLVIIKWTLVGILLNTLLGCQNVKCVPEVQPDEFPFVMDVLLYDQGPLPVSIWKPIKPKSSTLRLYIEGDGRAWIRPIRPSSNPTPVSRLVHQLMLQDSYNDIAYLSQPCQYFMNSNCDQDVWTFGRYSTKALKSMSMAMDYIKEKGNYQDFELVGYSGGGTMALLLAAHRFDVKSIRTIAGNLLPAMTNHIHGVSPMPEAMNPADFSSKLSSIAQLHFVGEQDKVVPLSIGHEFTARLKKNGCVAIHMVKAGHDNGWVEQWQQLLAITPVCRM